MLCLTAGVNLAYQAYGAGQFVVEQLLEEVNALQAELDQ